MPVDLIDRLGHSDIRRSLHTGNMRAARQRAWALILVVEDAFDRPTLCRPCAGPAKNVMFSTKLADGCNPSKTSRASEEGQARRRRIAGRRAYLGRDAMICFDIRRYRAVRRGKLCAIPASRAS